MLEFAGKTPALKELSDGEKALQKTLITLEIKDAEVEANGYKRIWPQNNKRIGMTTSGGYGHNVDKSLAMAFVEPEFSEPGLELKTYIVGIEKSCVVLGNSPWDPEGSRKRS